jgi:hypothetical protein
MSKVEHYKIKEHYKDLVEIKDTISDNLSKLYNDNFWKLKDLFSDYEKHCDELGKSCNNAWANGIMLLDYKWDNMDLSSIIINNITLNELESGKYSSLYTNGQKANNVKTDAGYANRIQFFIKTFPCFAKYKTNEDISWVAINNRELLLEIFKYHNDNKRSLATINKDIKAMVRVIKLLVGEDSELRYKMSALQVAFTELENNRDDENMILTENEKRQFINYDKLIEILDKLQKDYQDSVNKLPKSDRKNGMKHNDELFYKHQIILALALNIWDFPSRHEKFTMDIIYDNSVAEKDKNYILLKKLKNGKVSRIVHFIFNENVKKHTAISYKLDSTQLKEHNKKLSKLIKYSLDTYPRPYLFLGKDNWVKQNFTKASFNMICEWLRNVYVNKNICIDGFRSAFVSHYYPTLNNKLKEIMKTRMRTSRDIIERFYLKFEKEEPDKPDEKQDKPDEKQDKPDEKQDKPDEKQDKPDEKQDKPISLAEKKRLNYKKWYEANKQKKLEYNHNRNIDPKTKQRNILNDLNTGKTTLDNYKKETISKYKIYQQNEKFYGEELT